MESIELIVLGCFAIALVLFEPYIQYKKSKMIKDYDKAVCSIKEGGAA